MLYQGYKDLDEHCRSYCCNPWTRDCALLVKGSICDRLRETVISLRETNTLMVNLHLPGLQHHYRSNSPALGPGWSCSYHAA